MLAAYNNSSVVNKYLKEELEYGRLMKVQPPLASLVHVSKLGVIPKKHQPGKWRLIVDLSSPKGASINDFISTEFCSLSYKSVDDAAAYVFEAGRGTLLAKLDIKSAYRNVPVHPSDRHLLGIQWQGETFVDTCLPFGLRSAPKLFNAVADALEWVMVNEGGAQVEFVIHYLDDFLFGGRPGSEACSRALDHGLRLCRTVGFPVMQEKVLGPATVLDFLGFIIDTVSMEIRLPAEKLSRIRQTILSWRTKKSCTKRHLLSLIGNLQHASSVVKPGRTFLRRMIDLSKRQVHMDGHLRLNAEFRADIQWWATFLDAWNGVSVISTLCRRPIDARLVSDASGSWGCGAYLGNKWFALPWSSCPSWAEVNISVQELLPIVVSCAIWGSDMTGRHIRCLCDNAAVVVMINKHTSKHPTAMHLLRCLFFICARSNITLSAEHIAGVTNEAADALSRNNLSAFFLKVPAAHEAPSVIPPALIEILFNQSPNWLSAEWSSAFRACI